MSIINLLSPETASKIAAGEVVEKPASVVKELVENAIDAHCANLTVEIVNGGLDLIKITDDGLGIRNDDLSKAFMPHATSKIKEINDVFNITTLGFRGEALASVAAVSKTLLKSKNTADRDGMEIYIEGGEEKFIKYSPINQGTMIEVRELFWNVPARLKFMKNPQTEGSSVSNIMTRLALSYPEVAITYLNNEKQVFRTYGTGSLLDVIRAVYGKKTADNVTYFENNYDGFRIYGYIGNEELSRGSRNQETLIINRRYVTSRSLAVAVENAFKSFITVSKFPFFVLNIDLDPQSIDVNVHPQKAEIKFADDRLMFQSVFETVHKSLRDFYRDKLDFGEDRKSLYPTEFPVAEAISTLSFMQDPASNQAFNFPPHPGTNSKTQGVPNEGPLEGTLAQTKDQPNLPESAVISSPGDGDGPTPPRGEGLPWDETAPASGQGAGYPQGGLIREVDLPIDLKGYPRPREIQPIPPQERNGLPQGGAQGETAPKFPMMRIIGQFNKTYILAEINNTLFLVDQHAAHEKINFEKYFAEIAQSSLVIQPLMVPQVMDLSIEDYGVYINNQAVFAAAGFSIEDFGDRSISIREVPYFLGKTDLATYFTDILDNLRNLGKGTTKEVKYLRIATIACKASIKANDELSLREMELLLEALRHLKEPFTCPHGRPTMIRFPLADLEKLFRRRL